MRAHAEGDVRPGVGAEDVESVGIGVAGLVPVRRANMSMTVDPAGTGTPPTSVSFVAMRLMLRSGIS